MQTTICDCRKEGSSWKLPIYFEMIVNYYGIVNCPQLYSKQSVYKNSGNLVKSRLPLPIKKARDGIRTLPISGKLLKSRRNAHCLPCVYRLSTTWKSERKAVKGSAEQIHFTPLLLVIEVDNVSKL